MGTKTTFIGFGEAGQRFARRGDHAFDIKTLADTTAASKRDDYVVSGVHGCEIVETALMNAATIFSLVTADSALAVAMDCGAFLQPGALWLDMNSVAPWTKRAASFAIEACGGRYVDVAIMAPVHPQGLAVPLLVSGPHRAEAIEALHAHGFTHVADGGERIGEASAIKMIRSVLVKGLEALTTEVALAAHAAGVEDRVFASLDASWRSQSWSERSDYNLERMMVHGLRRAAEMEEVARTLAELGVDGALTRATIERQRAIGALGIVPHPGLATKVAALAPSRKDVAA